ncbi:helix-turn-helix domain-containing protein [Anaerotruncus rubiinfantis]|uniref:helix-turn-helix domain-containing protein n=1 Tax=Anaerotruncus rubiinfantis TaxID=1720200 RepID=UPI0034A38F9B
MFRIRLKELREELGLSQYAFASKIHFAQSTVGSWEAGKREPNFETTERLADFFNVSVDYLLGRTNQRNPRPEWTEEFYKDFYTLSDADKMRVFAENGIPEDLRPEFERISEQIKMPVTDLDNELIAAYEGNKDYLTEGDLNDIKKLIELRAELNRK